jgi:crotonobetainyl-CoA:carnitine CoA-transferase CaiB-like acyl-CoA transferase
MVSTSACDPLPLEGIVVIDFSQYLAGPSAALRLADLGARVIKVERSGSGEATRAMARASFNLDGDSLLFHTINRNKESVVADLKDSADRERVRGLVARADVVIQAFRPGVMERLGLGYTDVRALNDRVVYASVSGYGDHGPWRDKPGQDLLLQAVTGMTWLSGRANDPPTPFGLSIVDQIAGAHLCQGILACLVRRGVSGRGGLVEISLLESAVDLQFEGLTAFLNDGGIHPQRSSVVGAHPYAAAPYGIYELVDGYVAIAMTSVPALGELLGIHALVQYEDPDDAFKRRDEIQAVLADGLAARRVDEVLGVLEPAGVWCAQVLSWEQLVGQKAFQAMQMVIEVGSEARAFRTTRCPIMIDGVRLTSTRGAPRLGESRFDKEVTG